MPPGRRWNRDNGCGLFSQTGGLNIARKCGGGRDVAREASFEAKAQKQGSASVGSRRFVVLAGERRIRWAGGEYADAERWIEPRNHSRRGGNLRRQLGDVLRLRQRERRNIATRRRARQRWLRRVGRGGVSGVGGGGGRWGGGGGGG